MNQHHDNYKLNNDKNPSRPLKDEAGMKIRDYYPETPPSPVIIPSLHFFVHPFICIPLITGLPKKSTAIALSAHSSPERVFLIKVTLLC